MTTKSAENELANIIGQLPTASFRNRHGEKFNIHSDGVVVFLSGDEVDMMVDSKYKIDNKYIGLFNSKFNIWGKDELALLGKALQELSGD